MVLRRRQAVRQQAVAVEREQLDNLDPVGGWVGDADRDAREEREWVEAVQQREAAHQQQLRQHQGQQQNRIGQQDLQQ